MKIRELEPDHMIHRFTRLAKGCGHDRIFQTGVHFKSQKLLPLNERPFEGGMIRIQRRNDTEVTG